MTNWLKRLFGGSDSADSSDASASEAPAPATASEPPAAPAEPAAEPEASHEGVSEAGDEPA